MIVASSQARFTGAIARISDDGGCVSGHDTGFTSSLGEFTSSPDIMLAPKPHHAKWERYALMPFLKI
jgi:hypothetical protein